jgi:ribulose-phosphate 3-epimerase
LVLPRLQRVRELVAAAGATVDIQVAGGVKREHIAPLVNAGATAIAMGAGLYKVPDMAEEVRQMRALAEER